MIIKQLLLVHGLAFALGAPALASNGQFSGFSTKGNLSVWRVNHGDGAVSLCGFEGHTSEPACYPWSAGGRAGNYDIIPGDDVLSTWRINSSNGAVSLCEYKEVTDPPLCTPWSKD
ncbi:MAG TPA: hypothetical protein VL027_01315 [Spongiibacteraceae bacterium]|jgi:hypothetical protein|nr:hypothetical protein [Spongiibacteraceae bacterium]HUH36559.1 hypothetical protein [Spongiibacteraceae bacterium]